MRRRAGRGGARGFDVAGEFAAPTGAYFYGHGLAVDDETLAIGSPGLTNHGDGRVDVYRWTSSGWSASQTLTTSEIDGLGMSIAVDGDRMIVGATPLFAWWDVVDRLRVPTGYSFARFYSRGTDGVWAPESSFSDAGMGGTSELGLSVAILGDTAVAGAPTANPHAFDPSLPTASELRGVVQVYRRSNGAWTRAEVLADPNPAVGNLAGYVGRSVALSGNLCVGGASRGNRAIVWTRASGSAPFIWTKTLTAPLDALQFGGSVAISPDESTIAVGAPDSRVNNLGGKGAVFLFARDVLGQWVQTQKFTAPASSELMGFGSSVAFEGSRLVVGAPGITRDTQAYGSVNFTGLRTVAGAVHVYDRVSDGTWAYRESVVRANASSGEGFGSTVALQGGELYASAPLVVNANGSSGTLGRYEITDAGGGSGGSGGGGSGGGSDTAPPVLTLPSNIVEEATGASGKVVTFSATATDAVSGTATVTCSPASGSTFPIATTTVNCSATDAAGNQATGSFTVTVRDTTGPALSLPSNLTIEATSAAGAAATYAPTATDLVDGARPVTCTPASGSTFALGENTVSCTAADSRGNSTTGTFKVTVRDTTAPSLTMPANLTAEATGPNGATATFSATATDLVSGQIAATFVPAAGSTFPLGQTTVTGTARDAAGNTATGTFVVTVRDTMAPALSVPSNVTAEATSSSGAAVSFTATASDLVDGAVTVSCMPASGSTFALGTTTVTCTATDAAGNTSTGTFSVTVRDTTGPALSLPSALIAEATGASGAAVTFAATASDAVDGAVGVSCSPASGSTFALGTTTVNCTATDSRGNASSGSFQVTVRDTTAPTLSVPANVTAEATSGSGAAVSFTATASDLVDGAVTVSCSPASGSTFALGTTTVTCTAADAAGNTRTGTFSVTVRDTTAPVLSLPSNLVVSQTSSSGATATFSATASDTVDGTVSVSCSPASGSTFAVGTTTVTCTATDGAGNTATGTFTVTVKDVTPPAISSISLSPTSLWPANHKMVSIPWSGSATDQGTAVAVKLVAVTSNEPDDGQGDGDTAGDIEFNPATGALSLRAERSGGGNGRIYTLTFSATDAAGNSATTTRTVTVPKSQGK